MPMFPTIRAAKSCAVHFTNPTERMIPTYLRYCGTNTQRSDGRILFSI